MPTLLFGLSRLWGLTDIVEVLLVIDQFALLQKVTQSDFVKILVGDEWIIIEFID